MANQIYNGFKQLIGRHGIGIAQTVPPGTFSVGLLSTSYVFSQSHDFLDDVLTSLVGTAQPLPGATFTSKTLDGPDVTFPSVPGVAVGALLLFMDNRAATANGSNSRLIAYLDGSAPAPIAGLPFTGSGTNAVLTFDAAGILDL